VKTELRAGRDALEALWRQGLSGQVLLERHTQLVDSFLIQNFLDQNELGEDMTLVALGGYGRKELFPYSDIDLMLIYAPRAAKHLDTMTEKVFYPLWDAGLEVGHAVRTVRDCIVDAGRDFFFQVALLDARFLAGSEKLFDTLIKKFKKKFVEGRRSKFINEMKEHRIERHRRFGMHGYLLEPHIKESRGGFRDIQAILWTGQVVFGFKDFADMEEAGLFNRQEREDFEAARNQLTRIRNRLHYISGRKNDQLFFEHQEDMAEAFDFKKNKGLLGVEQFMGDLYNHLQTIAVTSDLFFDHLDEVIGKSWRKKKYQELEPGIEVRDGRLHFVDDNELKARPLLIMRIFVHMAKTGFPLHFRTRKIINENIAVIDDKQRQSRRMAKGFIDILMEAKNPAEVLSAFLETGVLVAYIPEFTTVQSLAQHDVYHISTVDRHLLQTVTELHGLMSEEGERFTSISSPHVLFLAAIFHDIGKGQGKDHSQYGAELVEGIGKRLGLSDSEISCLTFLVRYHLFLTDTAMRRDLEDETFILRCARLIEDPDRLTMLYLLSIADARATGPTVWTEWKKALLLELFLKISHLLERSDLINPDRIQNVNWMRSKLLNLLNDEKAKWVDVIPEDYLLSFTPEKIVEHIQLRDELSGQNCVVRTEAKNGHWSLLIMARDRTGLLAKICGTMSLHNLSVLNAQVFTWTDGTAVDVIDVSPWAEMQYEDQNWQALASDLNLALGNRLGLDHRLMKKSFPRQKRKKIGIKPASMVKIDNSSSDFYTIIEVFVEDRPKLLYDITHTLADFNLAIYRAKIATKADQLVDVFYVQDDLGGKIMDATLQEELRKSLLFAADREVV